MKKTDLIDGFHIVKFKEYPNDLWTSIETTKDGRIFIDKNGEWMSFDNFDNDLNDKEKDDGFGMDFSITHVGVLKHGTLIEKHVEWIWKREEETKELTVKEVSELLGYTVKIVE